MNRIRIALFNNRAHAEAIRDRLMQASIPAECHDEPRLARLWFASKAMAGVRLEVPAQSRERSTRLIGEWDAHGGAMSNAIRCPECGSFRVDYPQFTQKSLLTNLAMGLIAELRLIEKEYYCEDCHCMWSRVGTKPRRNRAHLAPDYFLESSRAEGTAEATATGTEPSEAVSESRWQVSHGKSHAGAIKTGRFHALKPWNKTLGIALPLSGVLQLLGGPSSLTAEAQGHWHSGITGAAERAGWSQVMAQTGSPAAAEPNTPTYLRDVLPIFAGKCASCHNDQARFLHNWFDYKTAVGDRLEIKRRVWNSWKGSYFKQPMPIANSPESEAMTEEEHTIIKDWVDAGAPYGVPPVDSTPKSKAQRIERGRRIFTTVCAVCHQPSGQGIPDRFPPLVGSDFLNSDKSRAIRIVLNGIEGEIFVNGQRFNNTMPSLPLADGDIAAALTYVYNSFGNSRKEVTPEEVRALRGQQGVVNAPGEKSPFE
jgi:mono/diheme cytochrome c family protein